MVPVEPLLAPAGFEYGDELVCEAPVEGIDRLSEEGVQRGLTDPLSDPADLGEGRPWGRGGSLVARDLDDDGDVDLIFGRLADPPDIYENDGEGQFSLVPERLTLRLNARVPSVAAIDLTGDGLPEIVLGGAPFMVYENLGALRFGEPTSLFSGSSLRGLVYLTMAFGDLDGDGDMDMALPSMGSIEDDGGPNGEPDPTLDLIAVRGEDGHTFIELDVDETGSTVQVGVFTDRDSDGDLDLFLPSDSGPPSRFWRNDGGVFLDDGPTIGADLRMAAMGIDTADLDGDGLLDYCMSDTGPPVCITTGTGSFVEVGAARGLLPAQPVGVGQTVGWSFDLADLDADGNLDALQASGPFPSAEGGVEHDLPNLLWHGQRDGSFQEVGASVGFASVDNDLGLATADVDGDGFLDVVVAGPLDVPALFMNRCSSGAWLEIALVGLAGNSRGHHAQVEILTTQEGVQRSRLRELHNVRGQSEGPATLHFGLGDVDVVDRLTVRWIDGATSVAERVPTRRRIQVTHPDR